MLLKQKLIDQIKNKEWFIGIRAETSLFSYSARYWNREKLTKREYKNSFVETLLFPKKQNYPVRAFNLTQAKKFHSESKTKISKNPKILKEYIDKDNENWKKIALLQKILKKYIIEDDYEKSLRAFKKLIEKYGIYGNLFFIIFSIGRMITLYDSVLKYDISKILKQHDKWRNSVAFKEEKLGKSFLYFIRMMIKEMNIESKPIEIMKWISVKEVINCAGGEIDNIQIKKIIKKRKKNSYVYMYLRDKKYRKVIDKEKDIKKIIEHFTTIFKEEKKQSSKLAGQVTYKPKEKIVGEVIVVKDKKDLKKIKQADFKDKVLATIQTTPHFIPYLKEVKAIITDEGGITCHAAIISREMKIPCIIGTKNATEILRDGDMVELDIKRGIIKIKE